jgi:hypothetical protein
MLNSIRARYRAATISTPISFTPSRLRRISIAGKLADLMARIRTRKATHKIATAGLHTNINGTRLTPAVLRNHLMQREKRRLPPPEMANVIMVFHFGEEIACQKQSIFPMERVKGIEPSYEAWEAAVLPLNYTRVPRILRAFWCV